MLRSRFAVPALLLGILAPPNCRAGDFAGSGTGSIPDNNASGINITFNVSGIAPAIGSLRLRLGLAHSYLGDIVATLRSPGGVSTLLVFGRVGVGLGQPIPDTGAFANMAGVYEFSDDASLDLWAVAVPLADAMNVPAGKYRTSGLGVAGTRHGGCSSSLAGAFNGLANAEANGTWTLNVADRLAGDTGNVTSAVLSVSASPDLFASGFEDPPRGVCQAARFDFTGSGRSSYVTLRNTSGTPGGAMAWTVQDNDGTATGAQQNFVFGVSTDTFTDTDVDGDGIADATYWRMSSGLGSPAQFVVRRSSRPGAIPLTVDFGLGGDDPTHSGDYDGDGLGDLAVFRPGVGAGAASRTLVRLSNGTTRNLVTGETGSFASSGIDYIGNGKADIAIQSDAGGGVASFRIFEGTNGGLIYSFNFGAPE